MSALLRSISRVFAAVLAFGVVAAYADVITFENLPDAYFFNGGGQNIGNFYTGVTLGPNVTGLSVSRFGGYANDAFPPHSGDVVVWDASDPTISIGFAAPVQSFGIWYTSFDPLTFEAFDASNNLLGSVMAPANTDGTTGITSLLSFSNPLISSVALTSSPGLFTLDDLSFQSGQTAVPEPGSLVLLGSALCILVLCRRARRREGAGLKLMLVLMFATIGPPLFCQTYGIPPELAGLVAPSPPSVRNQASTFATLASPSVGAVTTQTSDTTPPQLTGLTFTPSTINVSSAPQNVSVTLQITDDLSGADFSVFRPAFEFVSPSGNQIQLIESTSFTLISGSPLNGAWRATATFPQFAEPGTWKVSFVTLFDAAGNNVTLNTAALTAAGFPTTLTVTTTVGDTTPPQLTGLTFSRTAIDVTSSSQTFDITVTVTDNLSGVDFSCHAFCIYSIGLTSPSGRQQQNSANYNFTQVSGTPLNGQWKTTITIPRYSEAGTWTINGFHIWDSANNTLNLTTAQIQALGLPTTISITDDQPDTTAPHITSLAFNPAVAGSSPFRQLITVTLAANDDISGVDFIGGFATPEFSNVSIQLVSPTAIQTIAVTPYNSTFGLRSGNALNGVWQTSFILPGYSQTGTWTVASITLRDSAANYITFNTSQLNALGITTTFTVSASAVVTTFLGPAGTTANPTAFIAEPVNTSTGNYYSSHTDLAVRGRGLSFVFTRNYNSLDYYSGPLGVGWTHSYNVLLSENPQTGLVTIKNGNGGTSSFTPAGAGAYIPSVGVHDQLTKNSDSSFTLLLKSQVRLGFSPAGQLLSITDRNGNADTLAYDGFGNLTSVTDSIGRVFRLSYDSNNHLVSLIDPSGRKVQYSYDGNSNLIQFQDAAGGTYQYTYDSSHRLLSGTDPRSTVYVQNVYDTAGRVVSQKNGRGFSTTLAYNTPTAGTTTITDPLGNTTRHVYDANSRLVAIVNAQGASISYAYDASNNKISSTNGNGKTTQLAYDSNGNITSIVNALGKTASFTYDSSNHLSTATSPGGKSTVYSYDSRGNLTTVQDALGNKTTFAYDSSGQLTSHTNTAGKTWRFTYNSTGDLIQTSDPLGGATKFGYDAVSRLLSTTDANGHTTTQTYDPLDRAVKRVDNLGNQLQYTFDSIGNLTVFVDANGHQTKYQYDGANNLIQVADALGSVTSYGYDANNNRTAFTNAKGKSTAYAYDALNRRTLITDALGRTRSYGYDATGNIVSSTDGNGKLSTFIYDAMGRLLSRVFADGSSVTYTYDADGNRTTMADSHGTTAYSYDILNRITSITDPKGRVVQYGYSPTGRRTSLTYPDGRVVNYKYDDVNRLSQVNDWAGRVTAYSYDVAGNLTGVTYANGASTTYAYDSANRLISVVNRAGQKILSSFIYTMDPAGNRTQTIDIAGGVTSYSYDVLNRLLSWTPPSGQATTYSYDSVGNRTSVRTSVGTTAYSYDAADQLLTAGAASYSYDGNGNRVAKSSGSTTTTYAFDATNRLTAILTGSNTVQMEYDGAGNRIAMTASGLVTEYVNDVARVNPTAINETGVNGSVDYTYGRSLIGAGAASFDQFYQHDGTGSTATITDASGALKGNYTYDPWGKMLNPVDPLGNKNSFKFAGEALDATGLYYLRARFYDPTVGSFVSRDPLGGSPGIPNSTNRYTYARGNPTRFSDPSGRSVERILVSGRINVSSPTVAGGYSSSAQTNRTVNTTYNYAYPTSLPAYNFGSGFTDYSDAFTTNYSDPVSTSYTYPFTASYSYDFGYSGPDLSGGNSTASGYDPYSTRATSPTPTIGWDPNWAEHMYGTLPTESQIESQQEQQLTRAAGGHINPGDGSEVDDAPENSGQEDLFPPF